MARHKIIQEIELGGRNWGEILALPCVDGISKIHNADGVWTDCLVMLRASRTGDGDSGIAATAGDTLVEFDNHKWGVRLAVTGEIAGDANGPRAVNDES